MSVLIMRWWLFLISVARYRRRHGQKLLLKSCTNKLHCIPKMCFLLHLQGQQGRLTMTFPCSEIGGGIRRSNAATQSCQRCMGGHRSQRPREGPEKPEPIPPASASMAYPHFSESHAAQGIVRIEVDRQQSYRVRGTNHL